MSAASGCRPQLVELAVAGGVATITLNSPANRNALSATLRTQLAAALDKADQDGRARVIVLTHAGPVFCSGADLKEDPATEEPGAPVFTALLESIWASRKPVVARLSGPARAGGIGLIAACDISIAADSVSFAFTEVRIGVVPAVISATVLRKTSVGQIHELMLTGESFSAQRAVALGLINRAIPESELDGETDRYAAMLSRGAPNALAATKLLSRSERHSTLAQEHEELLTLSARHFGSEEGREGIRSFREKRQPSWVPRG